MSSATALSGRAGNFTAGGSLVARCTQWQVSPKLANSSEWGDSDSSGYTNRAAGRKDCTFTAEGKYDTGDSVMALFEPGDIVAVILAVPANAAFADGDNDAVGPTWTFTRALNNEFGLTCNIDTGEVIGWTSDWGVDGSYTYPS